MLILWKNWGRQNRFHFPQLMSCQMQNELRTAKEIKVRRHRCMTCDMSFDIYLTKPPHIIYKSSYCPGQDTYWHTFPLRWRGCWRGGPGEAAPGAGPASGTCPPWCGTCTMLCFYIYIICKCQLTSYYQNDNFVFSHDHCQIW